MNYLQLNLRKNRRIYFNNFKNYSVIILLFLFTSCEPFEFSPYEVPHLKESETNLNAKNIEKISSISSVNADSFNFAIISDTHIEYSTLEEVVNQINNDNDIRFVIHLGDMTDGGLYKEYNWTNEKMSKLNVPYIMVIGNHDYLSNGKLIYDKMYGSSSFTFIFNKTKFVCFDDVVWENNNTNPDFNWLNTNLSDNNLYKNTFVFSHIPPFSDQFNEYCELTFNNILASNNVKCSFHGHVHSYSFEQHYNNNSTWYFTADYLKNQKYYKIHVSDTFFNIQTISF